MAETYKSQIAKLQSRLDALEAESDIRRVVARYMEICDDLAPEAKPIRKPLEAIRAAKR